MVSILPKITQYSLKYISQLANNSDSIAPMLTKDVLSNTMAVRTYLKNSGKEDALERAIEDYSTGALWLLAIPFIKKIIDKTIYPVLKINPDVDCRNLNPQFIQNALKSPNITKEQKNFFENLTKGDISKYKNAFFSKFAFSTAMSALFLIGIIKLKQNITKQKLQKNVAKNNASNILIKASNKKEVLWQNFTSKNKINNQINFKGNPLSIFLNNPIANTAILDGVITTTRLKEARKGERKEVALKEGFQIAFIYGLAKPIQKFFETIGKKLNCPIDLDPCVIFDKNTVNNLITCKETILNLLDSVKDKNPKEASQYLKETIYNLDISQNKELFELLSQNQAVNLIKDNGAIKAIDCFSFVEGKDILKSLKGFLDLEKNINNLKAIKGYKVVSVIANIAIAIFAIGKLQPLLVLKMRKMLNNGDTRNPAIASQEKEIEKQTKLQ